MEDQKRLHIGRKFIIFSENIAYFLFIEKNCNKRRCKKNGICSRKDDQICHEYGNVQRKLLFYSVITK